VEDNSVSFALGDCLEGNRFQHLFCRAHRVAMWVRSSGKTSLGIAQLIVRGSVYILKDTGAGAALKPGVGDAAEFNSGQTLEMWFGSDSIYERVPDSDALSQKQK
jgi:hypothetical protein